MKASTSPRRSTSKGKPSKQPLATITVTVGSMLHELKTEADKAGTTPTWLARMMIDDGLDRLKSGKVRIVTPGEETVAGIPATPTPPDSGTPPPGYREAWRHRLGWTEEDTPPPTMDDLLPLEMRQRCLDLWLATGTNVLYTHVQGMFATMGDGGLEAMKLVTDSMEVDILGRLDDLRTKWEGGKPE